MEEEKNQLISHLAGIAPVSINQKDRRGWGTWTGSYMTVEGYAEYVANYNVPTNPEIWNNSMLPKIEVFNWTLIHQRLLTGENLEKRGIVGPFRCPLCAVNSETIPHLFLKCSYALSIWKEVTQIGGDGQQWAESIQDHFINWENRYHGELAQKKGVKACWLKLPKIICWCIWIERNQRVFQNKSQPEWKTAAKINALLGEVVRSKKIPNNKAELTEKEIKWMQSLNL